MLGARMRTVRFDKIVGNNFGQRSVSEKWRRDAPSTELRMHAGPEGAEGRMPEVILVPQPKTKAASCVGPLLFFDSGLG